MHQVIGGGPMPAYVRRPHDELLRAVLDPAAPASRLVVVRGGSSTGKTRAAYGGKSGMIIRTLAELQQPDEASLLFPPLGLGAKMP